MKDVRRDLEAEETLTPKTTRKAITCAKLGLTELNFVVSDGHGLGGERRFLEDSEEVNLPPLFVQLVRTCAFLGINFFTRQFRPGNLNIAVNV